MKVKVLENEGKTPDILHLRTQW